VDAVQDADEAPPEVCLINIGPRERRRRMMLGYVGFAVAVGLAVALILAGVPRWWRLFVFLPAALGGYGVFQARAAT
jgi:hypothetical protein